MTPLRHLFSPVRIGTMTAKNRMLMSAMSINFGVDAKGHVTEQLIEYFVARAKGGVGSMLVGGGAVHPTGLELPTFRPCGMMTAFISTTSIRMKICPGNGWGSGTENQRHKINESEQ